MQTALETWAVGSNQADVDYETRGGAVDVCSRGEGARGANEAGAAEALCGVSEELPRAGEDSGHGKAGKSQSKGDLVHEFHISKRHIRHASR